MKVIKDFIDKITSRYYKKGSDYTDSRVKELQKLGYIEKTRKEVTKNEK